MKKRLIAASLAVCSLGFGIAQAEDNVLTPAETTEGYKLLFDGTLKSFQDNFVDYVKGDSTNTNLDAGWKVNTTDKTLTLSTGNTNNRSDARSKKKYKDFELRWNYRIDGNQGVMYRSLLTTDRIWLTGVEYAINNVTNLGKDNPGAAYDLYAPPNPVPYNDFSTGKWNTARIICKGDSVEHWSNEVKVVGYKLHSASFWTAYNASKWVAEGPRTLTNLVPGRQDVGTGYIAEGYIGLQGDHGGKWQIKNFKITETPCFGPVKTDGSVCPVSGIVNAKAAVHAGLPVFRTGRGLEVALPEGIVMAAHLVNLDGTLADRGSISAGDRKATFSGNFKTGVYFLKLDMAGGSVTRKLNVF
jgi:hypothetical protein